MILYTSGTTSRPKGVVTTHGNLRAQVESLVEAWAWSPDDRILHVLPLHHTHGIVNALLCALWAGATCEMLPTFDARRVWTRFVEGGPTLFMAVPTIYARLIAEWESAAPSERERMSRAVRALRLMVSGSAALPVSVFERWREISAHALLERYGMTEIGMALSNPLDGERRAGTVGQPLPGVEVRLRDERGGETSGPEASGEIHVRGPGIFLEYWGRPEATRTAFRGDWFCTGDIAVVEDGYYRILGRSSVDIIKTGGYKVSALEIEETLRGHPAVKDCAVVGVADPEWGERVCTAVVPASPTSTDSADSLKEWLAARIAPYKLPRRWMFVDELPRNAMGKVTKPAVKELFDS
jgi:malonyl-CoA/methylmalonyl-CoA synthetase